MRGGGYLINYSTAAFDPATIAWVNAVIANGGSVSAIEQGYVDTLIRGLKTDGLFTKMDSLWLYALDASSRNEPSALTDIVALRLATNINSTPLTAGGYTGDGTTSMYIESNFNPSTAGGLFQQDSACFFGWNNTAGPNAGGLCGYNRTVVAIVDTRIFPEFNDGNCYWNVNDATGVVFANSGATGLYLANRSAPLVATLDLNGSQISNTANASVAVANLTFTALLAYGGGNFYAGQCSCFGFGGSLSGTDRTNLYTRLRTYMTAVGVP